MLTRTICKVVATAALGFGLLQTAGAAVVINTGINTSEIPGLTGFSTTGAMMDGLSVTATFNGGFTETLSWADTGATSGGVTGDNWTLSLSGDSFSNSWVFTNDRDQQLSSLSLNGLNAFTIFDRTNPSPGTGGSASGLDFNCVTAGVCDGTVNVTYDYLVNLAGNAAVGDLWQTVLIDFGQSGPRIDWSFVQDTDNDSRITQVPEPGSLALLSLALAGVGFSSRRRKSAK